MYERLRASGRLRVPSSVVQETGIDAVMPDGAVG